LDSYAGVLRFNGNTPYVADYDGNLHPDLTAIDGYAKDGINMEFHDSGQQMNTKDTPQTQVQLLLSVILFIAAEIGTGILFAILGVVDLLYGFTLKGKAKAVKPDKRSFLDTYLSLVAQICEARPISIIIMKSGLVKERPHGLSSVRSFLLCPTTLSSLIFCAFSLLVFFAKQHAAHN